MIFRFTSQSFASGVLLIYSHVDNLYCYLQGKGKLNLTIEVMIMKSNFIEKMVAKKMKQNAGKKMICHHVCVC